MRNEYPNPQFRRKDYQILNGEWNFDFDDDDILFKNDVPCFDSLTKKINVPFTYQSKASGINDLSYHPIMVYEKHFSLDKNLIGKNVLLKFNAVDFEAHVYLNGFYLGKHIGGYTHFEFDVSKVIKDENNHLIVKVIDKFDPAQPRGKQYWKEEPSRCWYNSNSGIHQSVYLEAFDEDCFSFCHINSDIDNNSVTFELQSKYSLGTQARIEISYKGQQVKKVITSLDEKQTKITIKLQEEDYIDEIHYWEIDNPCLYDVRLLLEKENKVLDEVNTYFGFRKIHVDNGYIYLNNRKLYQRLILDQGYFYEGDITPISVTQLKEDILIAKKMGFNGARKHQKIEDPYFYYYADQLGFLVWAEIPSAYYFSYQEIHNISNLIFETINQLYNHPSIITWVIFNESWGVRKILLDENQKSFVRGMYYYAKALDNTRLVDSNDGWEQISETDFIAIHDYHPFGDDFIKKYSKDNIDEVQPMGRKLLGYKEKYQNHPLLLTEYGGLSCLSDVQEKFFGYHVSSDKEKLLMNLSNLQKNVYLCPFQGFCYTQLTDVKQETNGLLDINHKPKFDIDVIRRIILNEQEN